MEKKTLQPSDINNSVATEKKAKLPTNAKPSRLASFFRKIVTLFKWLLYLLISAVLVWGIYLGYTKISLFIFQYQQQLNSLNEQLNQQEQHYLQLQAMLKQQQLEWQNESLKSWQELRQSSLAGLSRLEQQQQLLRQEVTQALSNNDYKWVYMEVGYWLNLAQQQLLLTAPKSSIIRLLEAANLQLSVWDSNFSQQLAKIIIEQDIPAINIHPNSNYLQIYQRLQKLQTQLVIEPEQLDTTPISRKTKQLEQVPLSPWQKFKKDSINVFRQHVSINKLEPRIVDINYTPEQKLQQILLSFEQAKLVLLQHDWINFKANIQSIIKQLNHSQHNAEIQETLQQILNSTEKTAPQKPYYLLSLEYYKNYHFQ